mgnify:CR=1 FL=1
MAGTGAKIAFVGIITFLIVIIFIFLILIIAYRKRLDNCIVSNYGTNMACPQTYCGKDPYPPPPETA